MTTTTTRAPKAPATKATKPTKPAEKAAAAKIKWTPEGERDENGNRPAIGVCGERTYAITGEGDSWTATVKVGRKTTVLVEGVGGKGKRAYNACIAHNKAAQTPAAEQPAVA